MGGSGSGSSSRRSERQRGFEFGDVPADVFDRRCNFRIRVRIENPNSDERARLTPGTRLSAALSGPEKIVLAINEEGEEVGTLEAPHILLIVECLERGFTYHVDVIENNDPLVIGVVFRVNDD